MDPKSAIYRKPAHEAKKGIKRPSQFKKRDDETPASRTLFNKNVLEAPAVRRYILHENVSNDITHFTHPNRLQLSSLEC